MRNAPHLKGGLSKTVWDASAFFEALNPSARVKVAAAASAITGFWMLLFANQSFHILHFQGIFAGIIVTKFIFASSFALVALQIFRMRLWGVYGALVVGTLTTSLTWAWLVFTFMNSVFNFMPLMVIPCAATTTGLTLLARGDVHRAEQEREKMQDDGLDLGT